MSKALEVNTLTVPNGTVSPTLESINVDPTAGGGHAAPLGSLLMRTDVVGLYIKTAAGNTAWTKLVSELLLRAVDYVATGVEGTDFMVTIGVTLPNDTYEVYWAPKGVALIPVLDLPDTLAGDRTTTQFRVITSSALTAGDILSFLVFQA